MTRKEKLLEELRLGREAVRRDASSIAAELDFAGKVRRSVLARPLAWLGGAAALGDILAGPKTRTVTKRIEAGGAKAKSRPSPGGIIGIVMALLKILIPLARPALSAYAARRMGEIAERMNR
jgi:hypothetical protein